MMIYDLYVVALLSEGFPTSEASQPIWPILRVADFNESDCWPITRSSSDSLFHAAANMGQPYEFKAVPCRMDLSLFK